MSYFKTQCYKCKKDIYGISNINGGTFYKDGITKNFKYHRRTCPSGFFDDNEQSGKIREKKKNAQNQNLSLFDELKNIEEIKKISRVCWNSLNYHKPSGFEGKSKDKNSFENMYGYGLEEWLFDLDKLIDGYHYSFLQSINKHFNKYSSNIFDISLYCNNSIDSTSYWIGEIRNVEIISKILSQETYELYVKENWIKEMKEDIEHINGDSDNFIQLKDESVFNIRFKPIDIHLFDENPIRFTDNEKIEHSRYTLLNNNVSLPKSLNEKLQFEIGNIKKGHTTISKTFVNKTIEYECLHNLIQDGFLEYLLNKYPGDKISKEVLKGNNRIDIVRSIGDNNLDYVFYEVKSYDNLKTSFRVAIGQLLEYSFFPTNNFTTNLIIVSYLKCDENLEGYLKHLSSLLNISFGYIQFDYESKKILQEINVYE